tara:strand:- start:7759 stop:8397 length:639 start_codon:yes stop_codon:yes gene_type:complete
MSKKKTIELEIYKDKIDTQIRNVSDWEQHTNLDKTGEIEYGPYSDKTQKAIKSWMSKFKKPKHLPKFGGIKKKKNTKKARKKEYKEKLKYKSKKVANNKKGGANYVFQKLHQFLEYNKYKNIKWSISGLYIDIIDYKSISDDMKLELKIFLDNHNFEYKELGLDLRIRHPEFNKKSTQQQIKELDDKYFRIIRDKRIKNLKIDISREDNYLL